MFDPGSRYMGIEWATAAVAKRDGSTHEVRYVRRRFLPRPGDASLRIVHRVVQGDRPDLVAARYAGDPLLAWRIADVNLVRRPSDLTDIPGSTVSIPVL